MVLSTFLRVIFIKFCSFFYFSKRSKVIYYHDIHSNNQYTSMSTPIRLFREHINIIRENGYEIVSEITEEYRQVEICFDDAFLGLYDNIEFLKEKNIPIHLFVVSSYIGKKNHINRQQLLELNQLGLIKISSHTHTHRLLHQIDKQSIVRELTESKNILENLLGVNIDAVCYPEGKFNFKIIDIAESVGYRKQYLSIPGFFYEKSGSNIIRRSLVQFAGIFEFKAILIGGDNLLSFWYKFKHHKK